MLSRLAPHVTLSKRRVGWYSLNCCWDMTTVTIPMTACLQHQQPPTCNPHRPRCASVRFWAGDGCCCIHSRGRRRAAKTSRKGGEQTLTWGGQVRRLLSTMLSAYRSATSKTSYTAVPKQPLLADRGRLADLRSTAASYHGTRKTARATMGPNSTAFPRKAGRRK